MHETNKSRKVFVRYSSRIFFTYYFARLFCSDYYFVGTQKTALPSLQFFAFTFQRLFSDSLMIKIILFIHRNIAQTQKTIFISFPLFILCSSLVHSWFNIQKTIAIFNASAYIILASLGLRLCWKHYLYFYDTIKLASTSLALLNAQSLAVAVLPFDVGTPRRASLLLIKWTVIYI